MVNLGEIDVLFHYKRIGQLQENPSFNFGTHEIDKISEKTLKGKAISHSARYVAYYSFTYRVFLTNIQARRGRGCAETTSLFGRIRLRPEQAVCGLQIQISFFGYAQTFPNQYSSIDNVTRGPTSGLHNPSFTFFGVRAESRRAS